MRPDVDDGVGWWWDPTGRHALLPYRLLGGQHDRPRRKCCESRILACERLSIPLWPGSENRPPGEKQARVDGCSRPRCCSGQGPLVDFLFEPRVCRSSPSWSCYTALLRLIFRVGI